MEIRKAIESNITAITQIAIETWNATYRSIVSQQQIDYMLQLFYNEKTLAAQLNDPHHHFWVLMEQDELIGYAHCIEDEHDATLVKLSKLYILPQFQRKQAGKKLMDHLEKELLKLAKTRIILNVNRANPAQHFYLKMGYKIIEEVDIPLDKFWLNDYVMGKNI